MEYVPGLSVDKAFLSAKCREDCDNYVRLSAKWLRGFHTADLSSDCRQGDDPAVILRRLEQRCRLLVVKRPEVAAGMTVVHDLSRQYKASHASLVPLHGDFKASNLIHSHENELYGVDLELRYRSFGFMDGAQFLVDALLNRYGFEFIKTEPANHLLSVFLEAYSCNSEEDRQQLSLWLLYFFISQWAKQLSSRRLRSGNDAHYRNIFSELIKIAA